MIEDTVDTSDKRFTNPLLIDEHIVHRVKCVLALLTTLNVKDCELGDEGSVGLYLVHEWLRRSLVYFHENSVVDGDSDVLYTNPLMGDDKVLDNVRAVLALLIAIDVGESSLSTDGNSGLNLIHAWLQRSLAYSGHENELSIPLSHASSKH